MIVPVTHRLDSGFDASQVHPGVLVVDGLGAVLAESVQVRDVRIRGVETTDVFDVPDSVMDDARQLFATLTRRRW